MDPQNGHLQAVFDAMDYTMSPTTPPVTTIQADNGSIAMVHTPQEYLSPNAAQSPTQATDPANDGIAAQLRFDIDALHQRLQQESTPSAETVTQLIQIFTTAPLVGVASLEIIKQLAPGTARNKTKEQMNKQPPKRKKKAARLTADESDYGVRLIVPTAPVVSQTAGTVSILPAPEREIFCILVGKGMKTFGGLVGGESEFGTHDNTAYFKVKFAQGTGAVSTVRLLFFTFLILQAPQPRRLLLHTFSNPFYVLTNATQQRPLAYSNFYWEVLPKYAFKQQNQVSPAVGLQDVLGKMPEFVGNVTNGLEVPVDQLQGLLIDRFGTVENFITESKFKAFWEWFYHALGLLTELKDEWLTGIFYGFLSRETAQDYLSDALTRCNINDPFIVRISQSSPNSLVISWLDRTPAGDGRRIPVEAKCDRTEVSSRGGLRTIVVRMKQKHHVSHSLRYDRAWLPFNADFPPGEAGEQTYLQLGNIL